MYRIQKSDFKKAAHVLGQSFIDYHVFKYIIPDDESRKNKIDSIFLFFIKNGIMNGEVIAPSHKIEGVSIWINSKNEATSFMNVLKAGYLNLFFQIGIRSIIRLTKIGIGKQKVRSEILKEP